jgi:putative ABC transport system permease protein
MFLIRTIQLGVKSLILHPMRSILTVLGIFIGVASVIWLLAIGEGISEEAQRQIQDLGATNVIVRSVRPPVEATASTSGPVEYGLRYDDYRKLTATLPTLQSALPIRELRRTFSFDGRNVDGRLVGCTSEYAEVMGLKLERGRFLEDTDEEEGHNYCVLSNGVAKTLFPYEDPIGRRVYMSESKDYFQVVGILKFRQAMSGIGGSLGAQDFQGDVYVPLSTLRRRIGSLVVTRRGSTFDAEILELSQITLRVRELETTEETGEVVRKTADVVRVMFNVRQEDKGKLPATTAITEVHSMNERPPREDIAVVVPEELLEQARVTRLMFMLFMGLIAAISLVVGGIGIMNIMLATVTERTREIGIRRALGATRSHIMWQFLVETVTLSVVGGATGIAVGLLCPKVIDLVRELVKANAPELMASLPEVVHRLQPRIVWGSLPLAFGISVAIGVVFGLYPAMRAAKMDPIEALRNE